MADDTKHIYVRDSRDRLIDLLGFGETYPLRDLDVVDDGLKVPFEETAKIPIENTQSPPVLPDVTPPWRDVLYELYDRREETQIDDIEEFGNGQRVVLVTPKVMEDITYRIRATKTETGTWAYLHETANVKVGLDVGLKARILEAQLLDPGLEPWPDTAPRLVHYGSTVDVQIDLSQEGVDYRLVHFVAGKEVELTETDTRGDGGNIVLRSKEIYEDTEIRIKATKIFDPSLERDPEIELLNVVLPLKVRANREVPVSAATPVIDYAKGATIKVGNTQASAKYRIYVGAIADRDFVHGIAPDGTLITVTADGKPVRIVRPPLSEVWPQSDPAGFAPIGDFKTGTGGELEFAIPSLTDDSVVLVQASKEHTSDFGADSEGAATTPPDYQATFASEVEATQAVAVLVRPDTERAISLKTWIEADGDTNGSLQVEGGQLGVFYYFRLAPDGQDLGLPAYFHKRDDGNESLNKGLEQLVIGVDFAIARSRPQSETDAATLASTAPLAPIVETGRLETGTTLHVWAVKAQTGLGAALVKTAQIADVPEIRPEQTVVDAGNTARVRVVESTQGDTYALVAGGETVESARTGDGKDIVFVTAPPSRDTTLDVVINRPGDSGIPVERVFLVELTGFDKTIAARIANQPLLDAGDPLADDTDPRLVYYNTAVTVGLSFSQGGVDYRLVYYDGENQIALSEADIRGTTNPIDLRARPATEDIDIRIIASKTPDPSAVPFAGTVPQEVLLDTVLPLKVRANPALAASVAPAIVDYNGATTVSITGTQRSVEYRVYARTILDGEFIHGEPPETPDPQVLSVDVEGSGQVRVPRPPLPEVWQDLDGFAPAGDFQSGNGGKLDLFVDSLSGDAVVIVQAHKDHIADHKPEEDGQRPTMPSAMQLEQAVMILVRPNADPALLVRAWMESPTAASALEVSGGQAGVFYHFRATADGDDVALPAYFHQRDGKDPAQNKGLDQLRIGVDFAVARDRPEIETDPGKLAATAPLAPILDTASLAADTPLHVRAVKAQTRVATMLAKQALIAAVPQIAPEATPIDAGSEARVAITASKQGDRYQLVLAGEPVEGARNGDGKDIVITTDPVERDTTFEMVVTRPADEGIRVERVVPVEVAVKAEPG